MPCNRTPVHEAPVIQLKGEDHTAHLHLEEDPIRWLFLEAGIALAISDRHHRPFFTSLLAFSFVVSFEDDLLLFIAQLDVLTEIMRVIKESFVGSGGEFLIGGILVCGSSKWQVCLMSQQD